MSLLWWNSKGIERKILKLYNSAEILKVEIVIEKLCHVWDWLSLYSLFLQSLFNRWNSKMISNKDIYTIYCVVNILQLKKITVHLKCKCKTKTYMAIIHIKFQTSDYTMKIHQNQFKIKITSLSFKKNHIQM